MTEYNYKTKIVFTQYDFDQKDGLDYVNEKSVEVAESQLSLAIKEITNGWYLKGQAESDYLAEGSEYFWQLFSHSFQCINTRGQHFPEQMHTLVFRKKN